MATPHVSIEDYEQTVEEKKNNSDVIVEVCENNSYSNFEECFPCAEEEYFNVETLKCDTCDGELNNETSKCDSKPYYLTNPQAPSIIAGPSEEELAAIVNETKENHPNTVVCPSETPYSDGTQCIACEAPNYFFNYVEKKCEGCSEEEIYNETSNTCDPKEKVYISENSDRLMATPHVSIEDYEQTVEEKKNNSDVIVEVCENNSYSNFEECFPCAEEEYFNVETLKCDTCDGELNNETSKCDLKEYLLTNPSA